MNRINPNALAIVALGAVLGALLGSTLVGLAVALAFVVLCSLLAP